MNLCITGGCGYIGTSLIDALHELDQVENIYVYDNLSSSRHDFFFNGKSLNKVTFVQGDILDSYRLKELLAATQKVDTLIHLAAFTSEPYNHIQNLQYEQVNRWGTQNVVRIANESPTVNRLMYLSSSSVYGFRSDIDIDTHPLPENAYGLSKFCGEEYLSLFRGRGHILRSAHVFGYNRSLRLDTVMNAFFFQALTTGKIRIYGDGEQDRAFVYLPHLIQHITQWVQNGQAIPLSFDFNASINDIRSFLQDRLPSLEYQFVNRHQTMSGQSFHQPRASDPRRRELMDDFFEEIRSHLTIVN